jgi:hypothetical protein
MKRTGAMERWNTNESLAASYRTDFLQSQSLLLAVGAIMLSTSYWMTIVIAVIAQIQTWYI